MKSAHLLSADDLSKQDALELLATAKELAAITDGPNKKLPTLRGKTVVNLFFEDSTRTRISFETAAKRLSAFAMEAAVPLSVLLTQNGYKLQLLMQGMELMSIQLKHY